MLKSNTVYGLAFLSDRIWLQLKNFVYFMWVISMQIRVGSVSVAINSCFATRRAFPTHHATFHYTTFLGRCHQSLRIGNLVSLGREGKSASTVGFVGTRKRSRWKRWHAVGMALSYMTCLRWWNVFRNPLVVWMLAHTIFWRLLKVKTWQTLAFIKRKLW